MQLHTNPADFRDAIEAAAQYLSMRPIVVEKDYWVTYVLKNLSLSEYRSLVVFKGGTSLSKAFQSIERFSEDIDLAVLPQESMSATALQNSLKPITTAITSGLEYIQAHPAEKKFGRNRTTAHAYPKVLPDKNFGVIKDYVLVEINSFTNPVPFEERPIETYIARFLRETGNEPMIAEAQLEPFTVQVLTQERTFFEKLLSLNRLSYKGMDALLEKIRHFYDIYQLYHQPGLRQSIFSPQSFGIVRLVLADDLANSTMAGDWIGRPLQASPLFSNLEAVWSELAPAYIASLSELAWSGSIPSQTDVLEVLKEVSTYVADFDEANPPESIS